jgi:hypothetical protein
MIHDILVTEWSLGEFGAFAQLRLDSTSIQTEIQGNCEHYINHDKIFEHIFLEIYCPSVAAE